ncbi:MAG TPA: class I SAM-dependent DNA methyltransferase [Dehalococcoidia bacterium]|nr:class I SAM-dependent DNA methyltransferase [Dehalococcoidia bacterium]
MADKLTLEGLNAHLWKSADILRGQIDSADYKGYIFDLLFLKRLSDVFDEERERVERDAGADVEDPDEYSVYIPARARWSAVRRQTEGIGEYLNKAVEEIEDVPSNAAKLETVLTTIDFNDDRRLGDARHRDGLLSRLIRHFSEIDLRNNALPEPDTFGRALEYLIEKFGDDAGKKGGEFLTPRKVVQLIVRLLEPQEGMRICDPTCGSGGMLIECAHEVERQGGDPRNLSLFGQEKNLGTWAICKMNLLAHGLLDADIRKGDTLRQPQLVRDGELMLFDRVIANPPFSLKDWGHDDAQHDPYGRFAYGMPPRTKGDLAFVQHMVATAGDRGMVGVVMPHGVLFRGAAEGTIRRQMLEGGPGVQGDLFEAVIGLPANLFFGVGIPAAILVLNRSKPAERAGKVLFIDASKDFEQGKRQNYLRDTDVERIADVFRAYQDVERFARVVPLDEIGANEWNLNISRYVDTSEPEQRIDVGEAIAHLREAERIRDEAARRMDALLAELGYP